MNSNFLNHSVKTKGAIGCLLIKQFTVVSSLYYTYIYMSGYEIAQSSSVTGPHKKVTM